jgi:hypothetical protein
LSRRAELRAFLDEQRATLPRLDVCSRATARVFSDVALWHGPRRTIAILERAGSEPVISMTAWVNGKTYRTLFSARICHHLEAAFRLSRGSAGGGSFVARYTDSRGGMVVRAFHASADRARAVSFSRVLTDGVIGKPTTLDGVELAGLEAAVAELRTLVPNPNLETP